MRPYWAILSARCRMLLQYRAAAAAGFGTQLFWGLIRLMILAAFYRASTAAQPISYPDVVSYVWLSQAFFAMLPFNTDTDLRQLIRSGNVAYELLRPVDLYGFWFSRAVALRAAPTMLRAVPMFIVAGLFFGLRPPASTASACAWLAATLAALLLAAAITALHSISMLWTISGEGASRVMGIGAYVLSGMVIPLPLLPDWLKAIVYALPFRGVVDTPARLYMGHIPPSQAVPALLQQLAWTVALIAFGRWLLARGTRRVVVQGG